MARLSPFTGRPLVALAVLLALTGGAAAQNPGAAAPRASASDSRRVAAPNAAAQAIGEQVRQAIAQGVDPKMRTIVTIGAKEKTPSTAPAGANVRADPAAPPAAVAPGAIPNPVAARQSARTRAAAIAGQGGATPASGPSGAAVHWSYEGDTGPQAWGRLKPEFNVCAIGRRQSPINIEESATLRGPAEAIRFDYRPSAASVLHTGQTIQVDVAGDNAIMVRGSRFGLVQLHFHHPSEERVNLRSFAMVAHLEHRNAEGQLAVLAILLEPGQANAAIDKIWTYMPLDAGDRVRMPDGLLDLRELLPRDQRYYQFIGSLTTPPCTEGVLWLVLKQPVAISQEQLRLFAQLFPNNARPVQPVNGRPIRDAQ